MVLPKEPKIPEYSTIFWKKKISGKTGIGNCLWCNFVFITRCENYACFKFSVSDVLILTPIASYRRPRTHAKWIIFGFYFFSSAKVYYLKKFYVHFVRCAIYKLFQLQLQHQGSVLIDLQRISYIRRWNICVTVYEHPRCPPSLWFSSCASKVAFIPTNWLLHIFLPILTPWTKFPSSRKLSKKGFQTIIITLHQLISVSFHIGRQALGRAWRVLNQDQQKKSLSIY